MGRDANDIIACMIESCSESDLSLFCRCFPLRCIGWCIAVLMTGVALYDQRLSFSLEKDSKRSNQIHVLLASMSYHVDSVQFILV